MSKKRDLALDEYGISRYRFRELYNFCLQYPEFLKEKQACYSLDARNINIEPYGKDDKGNIVYTAMPLGKGGKSDSTAQKAQRAIVLGEKIKLIEQTAIEAGGDVYSWLLKAVTTGTSWEEISPPCYEKKFRKLRRKFYYLLSLKK